jgi:hypothetical protein
MRRRAARGRGGSRNGRGSLRGSERAGSDPGARFGRREGFPSWLASAGGKWQSGRRRRRRGRSIGGEVGDFGEEGNRTDGVTHSRFRS